MNIFDVMGYGAIVAMEQDRGLVVTWNSGTTFNVFLVEGSSFIPIDAWQMMNPPSSVDEAKYDAKRWLKDN